MEERERQEKRKKRKRRKEKRERKGGKGERKTKVIMYTQSTQKQLIKTTKKAATSAISEHSIIRYSGNMQTFFTYK